MFIHKNTEDALKRIEELLREVEQSMVVNGRSNPKYLEIELLPIRQTLTVILETVKEPA